MSDVAATSLWTRFRRSPAGRWAVGLARRAIDGGVERYLNIRTSGSTSDRFGGHFGDSNQYEPLDYPFLMKCLKALALKEDDVVYEIGCGMGRVMCMLARRRVARCVGIELSKELADQARRNVVNVRGRVSPVEVQGLDATFADYSDGTAFYIFNSFGPKTLATVVGRIRGTVARHPRAVRFLYVNPLHEEVFEAAGWLRQSARLGSRWFRMRACLWVYDPAVSGVIRDEADAVPEVQFCCDVPLPEESPGVLSTGGGRDGW